MGYGCYWWPDDGCFRSRIGRPHRDRDKIKAARRAARKNRR